MSRRQLSRDLIVTDMLSGDERAWVDAYHARVWDLLSGQLEGDVKSWLKAACGPL